MPDWTDLKAEIASCWKVSWNVEPLALSVPLRAAPLDDEEDAPPPDEEAAGGVELDEVHADRPSAVAMTATPTVVTCCLRRRCISGYSF